MVYPKLLPPQTSRPEEPELKTHCYHDRVSLQYGTTSSWNRVSYMYLGDTLAVCVHKCPGSYHYSSAFRKQETLARIGSVLWSV